MISENNELKFLNENPGAVKHGNFINYYSFHPPEERIKYLPKDIWKNYNSLHCLDIGCNSGDLTYSLYKYIKNISEADVSIFGIDIDPVLIQRAKENNRDEKIYFQSLNFMNTEELKIVENDLTNNHLQKYDVIFCFSVTMWIHLNNGDEGLQLFLRNISKLGQLIVIEPQPWKCYKSAMKRLKNETSLKYKSLKLRQNVESEIINYLVKECNRILVCESEPSSWKRKVFILK